MIAVDAVELLVRVELDDDSTAAGANARFRPWWPGARAAAPRDPARSGESGRARCTVPATRFRRTSSSVCRTERCRSRTTRRTARCSSATVSAARARPWPSLIRPFDDRRPGLRSKVEEAQRVRDRDTALADPLGDLFVGESESGRSARDRPGPPRWHSGRRAGRSRRGPARASSSVGVSRTTAGIVVRPAWRAARTRRRHRPPARRSPVGVARTTTGWSTPWVAIDAASSAVDSSSKRSRG